MSVASFGRILSQLSHLLSFAGAHKVAMLPIEMVGHYLLVQYFGQVQNSCKLCPADEMDTAMSIGLNKHQHGASAIFKVIEQIRFQMQCNVSLKWTASFSNNYRVFGKTPFTKFLLIILSLKCLICLMGLWQQV